MIAPFSYDAIVSALMGAMSNVPFGSVAVAELVRALREVERLSNITSSDGVEVFESSSGVHFVGVQDPPVPIIITGGSNPYSWIEQEPLPDGTWGDKPDARSGTVVDDPAYERNDNPQIPVGSYALMWKAFRNAGVPYQEWVFDLCCRPDNWCADFDEGSEFEACAAEQERPSWCADFDEESCLEACLTQDHDVVIDVYCDTHTNELVVTKRTVRF